LKTVSSSAHPANFFAKIKQFRAIATRYEKTPRNFLAVVQLVASVIWLN
jgi:transposase